MSDASARRPILGLDLGITSVTAALFDDDGRARVVPNAEGDDATPAAVHVYDAGGVVVGTEALKMAAMDPGNVVEDVPWRLGETGWRPLLHGREWSAQELTGLVLQKVKHDVEDLRGITLDAAVIAVPAWFDSARRSAVTDAAQIAGLEVLSLVNQPLAAALGVEAHKLPQDGPIVVFDLGGRDLEVTTLEKTGDVLTVKASQTRYDLCLRAFEFKVRQFLVERYRADARGANETEDEVLAQQVVDAARGAMAALFHRDSTATRIAYAGVQSRVTLDRAIFGVRTAPLLVSAVGLVDQVLGEAGYRNDKVAACVAVGRGSRLPNVQAALRERFGARLLVPSDPDLCIARGAATLAVMRHDRAHPGLLAPTPRATTSGSISLPHAPSAPDASSGRQVASIGLADGGHSSPRTVQARDATSHDLGLIALDKDRHERVVRLLPKGTPLPCEVRGRFTYAYAGMRAVRVEVTEGVGSHRQDVSVIGSVELRGLPPRPIGTPIEIVYSYGIDQILRVQVVDLDSGMRRDADIRFRGSMAPGEIDRAAEHVSAIQYGKSS